MNGEGFAYFRWTQVREHSAVPSQWICYNMGGGDVRIETFYPNSWIESLARAREKLPLIRSLSKMSFADYLKRAADQSTERT